jgi:quercetin dioxygenase-like cupin family protein
MPKLVPHGSGRFGDVGDHRGYTLLSAADTGGAIVMFSMEADLHGGVPPHIHKREDEIFYILSGNFMFWVGEEAMATAAGDTVFAPRDIVHSWRCTSPEGGKAIVLLSPGANFEKYIFAVAEAGLSPNDPASIQRMVALSEHYGIEFLPPK